MASTVTNVGDPVSGAGIIRNTNLQSKESPISGTKSIYWLKIDNSANGADTAYLRIYDLAAGSVTEGTTDADHIFRVRPGKVLSIIFSDDKLELVNALTWAVATTVPGTTRPSSAVIVEAGYQ